MLMDSCYRVHTRSLYKLLGFNGEKIPKDFTKEYKDVMCPLDYKGIRTIKLDLKVYPQHGHCKHRIFAICPQCNKEMPIGRLAQHIGAKTTCVEPYRKPVRVQSTGSRDPWTIWTVDSKLWLEIHNLDNHFKYELA